MTKFEEEPKIPQIDDPDSVKGTDFIAKAFDLVQPKSNLGKLMWNTNMMVSGRLEETSKLVKANLLTNKQKFLNYTQSYLTDLNNNYGNIHPPNNALIDAKLSLVATKTYKPKKEFNLDNFAKNLTKKGWQSELFTTISTMVKDIIDFIQKNNLPIFMNKNSKSLYLNIFDITAKKPLKFTQKNLARYGVPFSGIQKNIVNKILTLYKAIKSSDIINEKKKIPDWIASRIVSRMTSNARSQVIRGYAKTEALQKAWIDDYAIKKNKAFAKFNEIYPA